MQLIWHAVVAVVALALAARVGWWLLRAWDRLIQRELAAAADDCRAGALTIADDYEPPRTRDHARLELQVTPFDFRSQS